MRTTVSINDSLLTRAREEAARKRMTLGEVIDIGLQEHFANDRANDPPPPPRLPTHRGRWIAPVDPLSNREVFDYLDSLDAATP